MYLFEEQEDYYSCGAYSFRNACAALGIRKSISECRKICNTISYYEAGMIHLKPSKLFRHPIRSFKEFLNAPGTSEDDLVKAVKKLKLKYEYIDSCTEDKAKRFINYHSIQENPIIIAVNYTFNNNDTGHWITCIGQHEDKFVIVDSAPLIGSVLQLLSWKKFRKRFFWYDEDERYFQLIGIALRKK